MDSTEAREKIIDFLHWRKFTCLAQESEELIADYILALIDPEQIRKEERMAIGEWLLEEYDATALGKRMGLLEDVITKLVAGQALREDR